MIYIWSIRCQSGVTAISGRKSNWMKIWMPLQVSLRVARHGIWINYLVDWKGFNLIHPSLNYLYWWKYNNTLVNSLSHYLLHGIQQNPLMFLLSTKTFRDQNGFRPKSLKKCVELSQRGGGVCTCVIWNLNDTYPCRVAWVPSPRKKWLYGSQIVHSSAFLGSFYSNILPSLALKTFSHLIYTDLKNSPGSWEKV